MDKEDLRSRLARLRNQINIMNLSITTLKMTLDELIVQYNELVSSCEETKEKPEEPTPQ